MYTYLWLPPCNKQAKSDKKCCFFLFLDIFLFIYLFIYLFYLFIYFFLNVCIFLSLLATASRLFAIAWGFTSGFSSQLFMRIFIRALLLNQTQCGTITVNWMWSSGILYDFFYFANITLTEIDLDNAIWNIDFKIRCSTTRATFVKALTRHGVLLITPWHPTASPMNHTALNYFIVFINWMLKLHQGISFMYPNLFLW